MKMTTKEVAIAAGAAAAGAALLWLLLEAIIKTSGDEDGIRVKNGSVVAEGEADGFALDSNDRWYKTKRPFGHCFTVVVRGGTCAGDFVSYKETSFTVTAVADKSTKTYTFSIVNGNKLSTPEADWKHYGKKIEIDSYTFTKVETSSLSCSDDSATMVAVIIPTQQAQCK